MLLRKMIEHVKAQNWLAVLLDFCIVVVGVFIGVQASNWSAARSNAAREEYALQLLQTEFEANIRALSSVEENYAGITARERIVAEAVTTGVLEDADIPAFEQAIAQIMYFSAMRLRESAYQALEQSGDLSLIRNQEILVALNEFNRRLDWTRSQRSAFREGISDLAHEWRGHIHHVPTDQYHVTRIDYDFQEIVADRRAASGLVQVARMKAIFSGYIEPLRENAVEVCLLLAAETGRPCAVQEDSGGE